MQVQGRWRRGVRYGRAEGGYLSSVLAIALLALVLLLSLGSVTVHQLRVSQQQNNSSRAQNAAEAVAALATQEILQNREFGQVGQPGREGIMDWSSPDGQAIGQLTFSPQKAEELGLPLSTNNFGHDAPTEGWKRLVPVEAVQIVATGTCLNATKRVEIVLHVPSYPYAIASTGPVRSEGPLLVGSLPSEGVELGALTADQLESAHVAANYIAEDSISLGAEAVVIGDLQSQGGVKLEPGAEVRGEVRGYDEGAPLPKLNIEDYRPEPDVSLALTDSLLTSPRVSGYQVRDGDLLVTDGLHLSDGVLYVDGNLSVRGGVHGQGAIISTGAINIHGGSSLTTDNRVAVVAKQDVTLLGKGQDSTFRGLIYTEGDFKAHGLTLVGNFVANGQPASVIDLEDARIWQESAPLKLDGFASGVAYFQDDGERGVTRLLDYSPPEKGLPEDVSAFSYTFHMVDDQTAEMVFNVSQGALPPFPESRIPFYFDGSSWTQGRNEVSDALHQYFTRVGENQSPRAVLKLVNLLNLMPRRLADAGPPPKPITVVKSWELSFNHFLPREDQVRVLYWHLH
jgi:hypothetical protein